MATSLKTIESLGKALALVPEVTFLPILGNYCICSRGRAFAMVCDDQLFLKISPETLCLFRDTTTRPYPGSVTMCKANDEWLEDPEKLGEVVLYTLASHQPPGPPAEAQAADPVQAAGDRRLVRLSLALGAGAVFTALYFILPYGVLSAIGIHKAERAENFAVAGLHGEKTELSECMGKPVFLYVWETNSQRAIDNLPVIDSLYSGYKDRQVCFMPVTITTDFNLSVKAFAASKNLKYPVYNGAGRLPARFLPRQSPMLYLIDHEGYVRDSYSPSVNDLEKISSGLEDLLRDVPLLPGS